ncbi:unnamed protein product [Peronospora belbahrii]|uniref:DNA polymerase epsilon catalytic subunit n=1 Tax=Peronospora belbahrii TaxID=622444 RepID=A0AAU9KT76_9STRA|nr:unnamed protein product [Peronospora belbahrii]
MIRQRRVHRHIVLENDDQFCRWLCSPNSLGFDLGAASDGESTDGQIDHTNYLQSFVKKLVRDAQIYLDFVLQTVLSNELFQVLNFTPKKYCSSLFFSDAENYGCILLKNVVLEEEQEKESEHDVEGSDKKKPLEIVSHWNIANYLPRGVDEYFLILVGQFIRRRAEFQYHKQPLDEDQKQLSPLAKFSQRLVSSYFSEKMLQLVPEILTYNMDRDSFPVFSGSHLVVKSPALELMKFVTSVFVL